MVSKIALVSNTSLTLTQQGTRKEQMSTDSEAAETDAQALMDAGSDRWSMTSPNSKLGQLIATASFDHLRAVFLQYEMVREHCLNSCRIGVDRCFVYVFTNIRLM